jgi:phosphoribosylformylglycinamidine cyclo-ligase
MDHNRQAYKDAGVNVEEGYKAVNLIKDMVKSTHNENVLGGIGSFAGMMTLGQGYEEPVLVSGTDGVGTKLKIAFMTDKHDTVGIDLVAMCVNDILCCGAKPLFFLDYIATSKVEAEKIAGIVKGITEGCLQSGAALLGGETAEMPGFYGEGHYDLAGFTVGVVDKKKMITGENIKEGDVIIGFNSSGIHSNGYSLVRKVLFEDNKLDINEKIDELGCTLGEELLKPTKIYVKDVLTLKEKLDIKGMCHITGGGFYENIPRMLPEGLTFDLDETSWEVPAIFNLIGRLANMKKEELYGTFNMGLGFMMVVAPEDADKAMEIIKAEGIKANVVGTIVGGK